MRKEVNNGPIAVEQQETQKRDDASAQPSTTSTDNINLLCKLLRSLGKRSDERCCEILYQLMCQEGFYLLEVYLQEKTEHRNSLLAFLKREQAEKILEKFMRHEDGKKAFRYQDILKPETKKPLMNPWLGEVNHSTPRHNIDILLGHYYFSKAYLLYSLSVACLVAAVYAKKGKTDKAKNRLAEIRNIWDLLTSQQKERMAKNPVPLIISDPSSSEANTSFLTAHDAFAVGKRASDACKDYFDQALSHGNLQALDAHMVVLNLCMEYFYESVNQKNPRLFAAQCTVLEKLLTDQEQYAQLAIQYPGLGNLYRGVYELNKYYLNQLQLVKTPEQQTSPLLHIIFAIQNKSTTEAYWHNAKTSSSLLFHQCNGIYKEAFTTAEQYLTGTFK